jgi:hypothetical protein
MGGQRHPQAAFHPGKGLGNHWAGSQVGPTFTLDGCGEEKFLDPAGVKPRTVQPLTSILGQVLYSFVLKWNCHYDLAPLIN